jgi:hypothetical protein
MAGRICWRVSVPGISWWRTVVIPLSRGVLQHARLPSSKLCVACFSAYLLPEPVFSRTPIGRRLSDVCESAPGGRSVPPLKKGGW